ncbi:hypothetical protein [Robbsia sp. KACC 23696]
MNESIRTLRADLIALLEAGLISEAQMRDFDTLWPAPVAEAIVDVV